MTHIILSTVAKKLSDRHRRVRSRAVVLRDVNNFRKVCQRVVTDDALCAVISSWCIRVSRQSTDIAEAFGVIATYLEKADAPICVEARYEGPEA
jgi:hypothetical protein